MTVRRCVLDALGAAAILFAAALPLGCDMSPQPTHAVRSALRRELRAGFHWFGRPTVDADDLQPVVRRFYQARGFDPAWTDGRRPTGDARSLLQSIDEAAKEGIDPEKYRPERLRGLMKSADAGLIGPPPSAHALSTLDLQLTRAFLTYAANLSSGQVDPRALPSDWHLSLRRPNLAPVLADAIRGHHVAQALADLAPRDPSYARLRAALERYRAIAGAGGWPAVPAGPPLHLGSRGSRVIALRARLTASGDLPAGARPSPIFDAGLDRGLRAFQDRHGLAADGNVQEDDLQQLNVPVQGRIRTLELNMERWRWVPSSLGDRYIMVNIPGYALELVENGSQTLASRVVVGKQYSPTPMFGDQISYVVINPSWSIPAKIAVNEIAPEVQADPSYVDRKGLHVYDAPGPDAREVDAHSVDWNNLPASYTVRQEPGADNPLGHIKFMCPNQFDVYLHDTPAGHLFNASERDLSHGCVRVESAVELATRLLQGVPGGSKDELLAAFASPAKDSIVRLKTPVPVYIFYWTAWVDARGAVEFRDDVYGLDHVVDQALRGRIATRAVSVRRCAPHHGPGAARARRGVAG